MWREGDRLHLDWTGTDPQVPGSVNFLLNIEMFKMFAGVFLIMAFAPDLVFNDGYYDLIEVTIPDGCALRPRFPAPLGNRLSLMARQFDVVDAVFSKALEQFAVTGGYGTSPNFVYSGTDEHGRDYQILEILYGGIPARPFADGLDGHSWWPLFKAVPTEYLEKYYPLRVLRYETRIDSGGAGYHRGGHGVAKTYEFLADGTISYQDDRSQTYPWGFQGGHHGAASAKTLIRVADGSHITLPSKVENVPVRRGDRLVFSTAGAGGLGDPLTREPERVAADVRAGLVQRRGGPQLLRRGRLGGGRGRHRRDRGRTCSGRLRARRGSRGRKRPVLPRERCRCLRLRSGAGAQRARRADRLGAARIRRLDGRPAPPRRLAVRGARGRHRGRQEPRSTAEPPGGARGRRLGRREPRSAAAAALAPGIGRLLGCWPRLRAASQAENLAGVAQSVRAAES